MNQRTPRMWPRTILTCLLVMAITAAAPVSRAADEEDIIHVVTPLGSFEIRLFRDVAPVTVANFLRYIEDGDFADSFIHRSVPEFVIQGGGFRINDDLTTSSVPEDPPIVNEFSLSNVRGTIAMAKLEGNPNSATSQWFINLADNGSTLDGQNGGFTVFGEVLGDGMAVVDTIATIPTFNSGGAFTEIPLINYTPPVSPLRENLVLTTFSVLSTTVNAGARTVLLRHSGDGRWFSYKLVFADDAARIEQKGAVGLTRDSAFGTVSRSDFDGDLEPDVLLRESGDGEPRLSAGATRAGAGGWILATLAGKKVTSEGDVDLTPDPDFELVSSDDFNGDDRADLLLRNSVDGSWLLYRLNGQTVASEIVLGLGTSRDDQLMSTADFNADGRADLLLQRANGTWRLYASNGTGGYTISTPKIAKSRKYTLQAVADFDGDGFSDVLLRDAKGKWRLHLLNGQKVRKRGTVGLPRDTEVTLESHADFNGDGKADALLRGADGSWFLYTLDGTQILGEGALEMSTDLGHQIVSTEDFNGDGKADALLRHTEDGDWLLYALDGNGPTVLGSDAPKMNKSTDWVVQRH